MNEHVTIEQFTMGNKPGIVDTKPVIGYYDANGCGKLEEGKYTVCKEAYDPSTKRSRYFVKVAKRGLKRGSFFDPASDNKEDLIKQSAGEAMYEYREISKYSFNLYWDYLHSKSNDTSLLRHAERNA